MATQPSKENRYVLFSGGTVVDLLDLSDGNDIDNFVAQLSEKRGKVLKAANSPLKIFSEILGFKKTGEISKFGQTNWSNLFLVHGEFDFFLATVVIDNTRYIVAKSTSGVFWSFNIVDA